MDTNLQENKSIKKDQSGDGFNSLLKDAVAWTRVVAMEVMGRGFRFCQSVSICEFVPTQSNSDTTHLEIASYPTG